MADKVILIIRDGWGVAPAGKFNAVTSANTPNVSSYLKKYPYTLIDASGLPVGVPAGNQGSSEVGHLNMGAGRIVKQEIVRIDEALADGSFFKNPCFKSAIDNCEKNKDAALHFMGLLQDEGVHAHQNHLFAMLKHAGEKGLKKVYVHIFGDGRDTPPRSIKKYLAMLEEKFREYGTGKVGTIVGRYYAMDRGEKWKLVDKAYNLLTKAEGKKAATALEAVETAYKSEKAPDGSDMFDEYIEPVVIGDFTGIKDGDSVIHYNYRQDRAIELTKCFIDDNYPGNRWKKLNINYCGLTRYYDEFKFNVIGPLDEGGLMDNLAGETIAKNGLKQLRIAETQKFKHVTSFFNGKRVEPYEGEERIELKGRFDPSAFADHPEMEAYLVRDEVVKQLKTKKFDCIVLNYANCDMVGHTGVFEAAKKAVEVVDECVGDTVKAALESGYKVLLTADHGNAEEMWDDVSNGPKTSHTTNKVELIYIADDADRVKVKNGGKLGDIGVTILKLLGVKVPKECSADDMLVK